MIMQGQYSIRNNYGWVSRNHNEWLVLKKNSYVNADQTLKPVFRRVSKVTYDGIGYKCSCQYVLFFSSFRYNFNIYLYSILNQIAGGFRYEKHL